METTDHLFTLIKSLSRSEKGYFKKYSNFYDKEKKNYVKIFNAMDLQKVYNEPKLIKKFKKERFIKQFSVAKKYLYDILMESLESYHKTATIELRSMLNRAEILIDKGLYKQAQKILKKAKDTAVHREKLSYISEINLMEQNIYRLQHDVKSLSGNIKTLNYEIEKAAQQIKNVAEYEKIKNLVYLQYIENGGLFNDEDVKQMEKHFESISLPDHQPLSAFAEILFYELRCDYYEYIGDAKKSYLYSLKVIEQIKRKPFVLEDTLNSPALFLHKHSIRCSNAGMFDESKDTITALESLIPKTEVQKRNIQLMILHARLSTALKTGQIKQCLALIPEINQEIETNKYVDILLKEKIGRLIILTLMIAGQYKSALSWFIKVNSEEVVKYDYAGVNRIIELILHHELDNYDIIGYRLKSARRLLSLKNKFKDKHYSFENAFLLLFQYLETNDDKEIYTDLPDRIKLLLGSEMAAFAEKNSLTHDVIISWFKSKMNNQQLETIFFNKPEAVEIKEFSYKTAAG